jgi:hypothetical protein
MGLSRLQRCRRTIGTVALLVLLAIPLLDPGCAPREKDPAKRILSKAIKNLGGLKRTRSWMTRIERGILTQNRPGWGTLRADCTFYVKKPAKLKMDQDFSAYDHPFYFEYYLNEGDGWAVVNANTHQNPRITANLEEYMKDVDGLPYYYDVCDTFFLAGEVPDDSLFAGAAITRVGCVHDGDTVMFDFSTESHLPVRVIKQGGATHIILDDYRKTCGIKTPFHRTMYENGTMTADYVWEEVTFDEQIDDAVFEENRPPKQEEAG